MKILTTEKQLANLEPNNNLQLWNYGRNFAFMEQGTRNYELFGTRSDYEEALSYFDVEIKKFGSLQEQIRTYIMRNL